MPFLLLYYYYPVLADETGETVVACGVREARCHMACEENLYDLTICLNVKEFYGLPGVLLDSTVIRFC